MLNILNTTLALRKKIDYTKVYSKMPKLYKTYSERTAIFCEILYSEALKQNIYPCDKDLHPVYTNYIKRAVKYYDIGFSKIPENLWCYDTDFGDKEIIKKHLDIGLDIFIGDRSDAEILNDKTEQSIIFKLAQDAIISHHEKWDGTGLPFGQKAEDIPVIGRICSICDAYEHLTEGRKNIKSVDYEYARCEIIKKSGTAFDPKLIEVFKNCADKFKDI